MQSKLDSGEDDNAPYSGGANIFIKKAIEAESKSDNSEVILRGSSSNKEESEDEISKDLKKKLAILQETKKR